MVWDCLLFGLVMFDDAVDAQLSGKPGPRRPDRDEVERKNKERKKEWCLIDLGWMGAFVSKKNDKNHIDMGFAAHIFSDSGLPKRRSSARVPWALADATDLTGPQMTVRPVAPEIRGFLRNWLQRDLPNKTKHFQK